MFLGITAVAFNSDGDLAYGMTESCSCITAHLLEKYDYKYGHSVGTICANTEIKVIDLDGNELGLNEPGELRVRFDFQNSGHWLIQHTFRRSWQRVPKS